MPTSPISERTVSPFALRVPRSTERTYSIVDDLIHDDLRDVEDVAHYLKGRSK